MKKRAFILLLCVVLFGTLLCGCEMLFVEEEGGSNRRTGSTNEDEGSIRRKVKFDTNVALPRDGFYYESADLDSRIVNVFYAGEDVWVSEMLEIDDLRWFHTEYGWFCTEIATSCYSERFQDTLQVNDNYLALESDVSGRVGPGADFEVKKTLQQGQQARIIETTRDGQWGFSTIYGWLKLCDLVPVE